MLNRSRRRIRRAFAGTTLAAVLVPTVLGGTPASAAGSATSGWFTYYTGFVPPPDILHCALGNDTVSVLNYPQYNMFYVVANSETLTLKGGYCFGGDYYPGYNAIRSQAALIYWAGSTATLCSLSPNAYSGSTNYALAAAATQCGYGYYSSTSFHDATLDGAHRTALMATTQVYAP